MKRISILGGGCLFVALFVWWLVEANASGLMEQRPGIPGMGGSLRGSESPQQQGRPVSPKTHRILQSSGDDISKGRQQLLLECRGASDSQPLSVRAYRQSKDRDTYIQVSGVEVKLLEAGRLSLVLPIGCSGRVSLVALQGTDRAGICDIRLPSIVETPLSMSCELEPVATVGGTASFKNGQPAEGTLVECLLKRRSYRGLNGDPVWGGVVNGDGEWELLTGVPFGEHVVRVSRGGEFHGGVNVDRKRQRFDLQVQRIACVSGVVLGWGESVAGRCRVVARSLGVPGLAPSKKSWPQSNGDFVIDVSTEKGVELGVESVETGFVHWSGMVVNQNTERAEVVWPSERRMQFQVATPGEMLRHGAFRVLVTKPAAARKDCLLDVGKPSVLLWVGDYEIMPVMTDPAILGVPQKVEVLAGEGDQVVTLQASPGKQALLECVGEEGGIQKAKVEVFHVMDDAFEMSWKEPGKVGLGAESKWVCVKNLETNELGQARWFERSLETKLFAIRVVAKGYERALVRMCRFNDGETLTIIMSEAGSVRLDVVAHGVDPSERLEWVVGLKNGKKVWPDMPLVMHEHLGYDEVLLEDVPVGQWQVVIGRRNLGWVEPKQQVWVSVRAGEMASSAIDISSVRQLVGVVQVGYRDGEFPDPKILIARVGSDIHAEQGVEGVVSPDGRVDLRLADGDYIAMSAKNTGGRLRWLYGRLEVRGLMPPKLDMEAYEVELELRDHAGRRLINEWVEVSAPVWGRARWKTNKEGRISSGWGPFEAYEVSWEGKRAVVDYQVAPAASKTVILK